MDINEDDELDPDLLLDMPAQQPGGLFGIGNDLGHELDLNGSELELGSGFGTVQQFMDDPVRSHSKDPSQFSLADELAGMQSGHNRNASVTSTTFEVDTGSGLQDVEEDPLPPSYGHKNPSSARPSTVPSLAADEAVVEPDSSAVTAEIANGFVLLDTFIRDNENFRIHVLKDVSRSSVVLQSREGRVEDLGSMLIRSMYETARRREEATKEMEAAATLVAAEMAWIHLHEINDASIREDQGETDDGTVSTATMATDHINWQDSVITLRSLTEVLAASLGGIAEQLQVSKATYSETSRKLKSIEHALGRLKSEAESLQASHDRISAWHVRDFVSSSSISEVKETSLPGLSRSVMNGNECLHQPSRYHSPSKASDQALSHLADAQNMVDLAKIRAEQLLSEAN